MLESDEDILKYCKEIFRILGMIPGNEKNQDKINKAMNDYRDKKISIEDLKKIVDDINQRIIKKLPGYFITFIVNYCDCQSLINYNDILEDLSHYIVDKEANVAFDNLLMIIKNPLNDIINSDEALLKIFKEKEARDQLLFFIYEIEMKIGDDCEWFFTFAKLLFLYDWGNGDVRLDELVDELRNNWRKIYQKIAEPVLKLTLTPNNSENDN